MELINFNKNKKLLGLFCILLVSYYFYLNHTPRICVIAEIDLKKEFILTTSPLSPSELESAGRSLQLIKEIDPTQSYVGIENIEVHWMDSKKYFGITVYRSDESVIIILDQSLKIKNVKNPWEYIRFGAIYSHELSHALNGTKDPHTEEITDVRLWTMIRNSSDLKKHISDWKP